MTARTIAKLFGTFHNISYYAPEMKAFADVGLPEYWRAYMAYRSAPMGRVPASVVESTFYNFAPTHVLAAVPSAWDTTTEDQVLELRDRCIDQALHRALGHVDGDALLEASDLALTPILACDAGARPLFAAHRELPIPDTPLLRLWFTATLWREHRGDGHNIALASAGIDGVECHVLLAAKGVGEQSIIEKIRGWSLEEWDAAQARLVHRGLLTESGEFTGKGRQLRADIESDTDRLAAQPRLLLGGATSRVVALLQPLVDQLISSGSVPGRWPPKSPPTNT